MSLRQLNFLDTQVLYHDPSNAIAATHAHEWRSEELPHRPNQHMFPNNLVPSMKADTTFTSA